MVFKYDSVYVSAGVTLSFKNNATTAPVAWLVTRGVRIDGTVSVDGQYDPAVGQLAVPGPGGFRGGKGTTPLTGGGGPGLGPGGGGYASVSSSGGGGGGYGSSGNTGVNNGGGPGAGGGTYGSPQIVPLIGGSGGGGTIDQQGGGAGGGALLIAAGKSIAITGTISANGGGSTTSSDGGGGGSGGAIRVVADVLAGAGSLLAIGGNTFQPGNLGDGGFGRIRLEANSTTFTGGSSPSYTLHLPVGPVPTIWPPAGSPSVTIATVAGVAVPTDPNGNLLGGDIQISSATAVPVTISAANVPSNATMALRAVLVTGATAVTVSATFASGDQTASTWTATLPAIANNAYTLLQARVTIP